jgi:hypothetical protein
MMRIARISSPRSTKLVPRPGGSESLRLRGNHFQIIVETPSPNLLAGVKWLRGTTPAIQPVAPVLWAFG